MKINKVKSILIVLILFISILQLSSCGDKNKDFYGYWSGEENNLPVTYDIKITKDNIFDLGADKKIFKYNYVMRTDTDEPTIEVPKEELAKGIPELKQTTGDSFLLLRLLENKDKLIMITALDGTPSAATLYKKTKKESPLGKVEKSSKNWLFLLISIIVVIYVIKRRKSGNKI